MTSIGSYAFYQCSSLSEITLPNSMATIDSYAFHNCSSLTDVNYTGTEKQWTSISTGDYNGYLLTAQIHFGGANQEHNYNSVVTAPTCTERGYTTHTCTKCGHSYVDSYVNAKGHTEVTVAGKAATCIETGLTDGKKCSVCGMITVKQEMIPAMEHNFMNGICSVCGEKDNALSGEANGDDSINSSDVNFIYRFVLNYTELTDEQIIFADVNDDGKVNSADVNLLYRYVMGYVQNLIA